MSSSKKKRSNDFSQALQKILSLSSNQIKALDEIELTFYREYIFKGEGRLTEQGLKLKYLRKIVNLLSADQLQLLKATKQQAITQKEKREADNENMHLNQNRKRFERLEMDEETFVRFSKALKELRVEMKEKAIQRIKSKGQLPNNRYEDLQIKSKKALDGILNPEQFNQYLNILEQEEKMRLEWEINYKKGEFQRKGVGINLKQAAAVLDFENNNSQYDKNGICYSEWEKLEMELKLMKTILDENQLQQYQAYQEERFGQLNAEIKKSDASYGQQIERHENHYRYLVKNYLLVKCKWRSQLETLLTDRQKADISQLRKVYNEKLSEQLRQSQAEHQRFYRGQGHNEYKLTEIRIKQSRLIPNAWYIKDDPRCKTLLTPAVEEYLSHPSAELIKANEALQAFNISNYEAHGGQYGGWIHVVKPAPGEAYIGQVSTLLLHPEVKANLANANYTID